MSGLIEHSMLNEPWRLWAGGNWGTRRIDQTRPHRGGEGKGSFNVGSQCRGRTSGVSMSVHVLLHKYQLMWLPYRPLASANI